MTKKEQSEQNEVRETLLQWLKPGDTVYTILDHVSRSGMQRRVRVVILLPATAHKGGDERQTVTLHPNYSIAKLCGYRLARGYRDALVVNGCGFDAGHEIVSNLSYALWPDGFDCTGAGCPSNDHANHVTPPEGTCTDHVQRTTGVCTSQDCKPWRHKGNGYALRHEWL